MGKSPKRSVARSLKSPKRSLESARSLKSPKPRCTKEYPHFIEYDRSRGPNTNRAFMVFEPQLFDLARLEWEKKLNLPYLGSFQPKEQYHLKRLIRRTKREMKKKIKKARKDGKKKRQQLESEVRKCLEDKLPPPPKTELIEETHLEPRSKPVVARKFWISDKKRTLRD